MLSEQASSSKKPPEVIEKMVTGRLQKVCLAVSATCMHRLMDKVSDVGYVAEVLRSSIATIGQMEIYQAIFSACVCQCLPTACSS